MSISLVRWRRLLPLTFGSLALLSLVLLDGGWLVAQGKKDAKASKSKGDDAEVKEEKKAEVKYVANIPPRKDKFGSQGAKQIQQIDDLIKQNWLANKVNPSDRCTDYEFIRRVTLDIAGRIATEKELEKFMKQPEDKRRSWLVDQLLTSPEFGENFSNIWTVMLLTRTGSQKMYQEQLREWLTDRLNEKDADWSKIATDLLTARGKSNDNPAINFIAHHTGELIQADQSKKGSASPDELRENGKWDMVPITSRTTKLFLGLRTQCVQCHDHPFNGEWQQHHFWGINAFFRQTSVSQRPGMMMQKKGKPGLKPPQVELVDFPEYNAKGVVSFERRSAVVLYTGMQFLDGTRIKPQTIPTGKTRRDELARLITTSPYFAKVFVNRTWAHFFGKSFTKDGPDDFGDHNPVTNPELLDFLTEEFAKSYNHNPKELVRWICNSQAYGLSSKATKWNDKMDDEVLFARMLLKPMTPEQLFESLMTATASKITADKAQKHALREKWLDDLVLNFGNDEGEEGTFSGTVVQALLLMNGQDINKSINDPEVGTVANVIREKGLLTRASVDKLYLAALNRKCTEAEWTRINSPDTYRYLNNAVAAKVNMRSADFFGKYYQDLFWALLNSNEFILNH